MAIKRRKLPIGVSDFKKIMTDNYYYVDKSLLIKDIIDDGSDILLLPRPRRFGKTLNMMMLKYFFEKTTEDHSILFKDLAIWNHEEYCAYQGQYPVIYLTFKDLKDESWEKCYAKLRELIWQEYLRHHELLETNLLFAPEKNYIQKILSQEASEGEYETALKNLTAYLFRIYQQKVIILIDEYDVPIQSGYMHHYYLKIVRFMRNFLSGGLKDNVYLEKAVLTGIMRIAKESIFSGLNNPKVCTIINNQYSDKFGLLESEVEQLLKHYGIAVEFDAVKKWYNGYTFGEHLIYNPWSIINYADRYDEGFRAYWVNTSNNDLVQKLITEGGSELKSELEELIQGGEIVKEISEDIVFNEIEKNAATVWSFLLFCGYLKVTSKKLDETGLSCTLAIPNKEVAYLYRNIILGWFKEALSTNNFKLLFSSLLSGEVETFEEVLAEYLEKTLSYFDIGGNEPEKFYHALVLGMLVALSSSHTIKSNRESGRGRYDIMIIPHDKTAKGIIIEFKKVNKRRGETLDTATDAALEQIREKNYRQELLEIGITEIIELGIAFDGKEVLVRKAE